jgi:hypothetical protein
MTHIPIQPPKEKPVYWFRAKRYGWGWDLPLTWQGWVTYIAFVFLLTLTAISSQFDTNEGVFTFVRIVIALDMLLISVTWWKGEPARWRWGKDEAEEK